LPAVLAGGKIRESPPTPSENSPIRIGHCQLETKCGDFEGNLARVVKGLERADRERVEILCFPECFLTGCPEREQPHPQLWPGYLVSAVCAAHRGADKK